MLSLIYQQCSLIPHAKGLRPEAKQAGTDRTICDKQWGCSTCNFTYWPCIGMNTKKLANDWQMVQCLATGFDPKLKSRLCGNAIIIQLTMLPTIHLLGLSDLSKRDSGPNLQCDIYIHLQPAPLQKVFPLVLFPLVLNIKREHSGNQACLHSTVALHSRVWQ